MGSQLFGKTVYVEPSEAEKNVEAASNVKESNRIFISNLYPKVTEDMLRAVFEKFGDIEYLNLHSNTGSDATRGFAFVQYKKKESAQRALSMNGSEICGYAMKVGFVSPLDDIENQNDASDVTTELEDVDYINEKQRYQLMQSLKSRSFAGE